MRWCWMILLLAGCASQTRPQPEPRDPWADYEPRDRQTYDRAYAPPNAEERALEAADQAVRRAREAEARARGDQARVEYQIAFRRDRWHVGANQGYQDLMLDHELFDALWREYFDLWYANQSRGDALYFHLRPLLASRDDEGWAQVKYPEPGADQRAELERHLEAATTARREGRAADAMESVDRALAIAALPEAHRLRVGLLDPETARADYARLAEEDPASGDAVALHALALARTDRPAAIVMLRDALVLELPGYWLPFTLAELCEAQGDAAREAVGDDPPRDRKRDILGWYALARDLYDLCLRTRANHATTPARHLAAKIEHVAG